MRAPLLSGGFLGCGGRTGSRSALFGAPLDATVTFRPGSRFGPMAVRAASPVLEDWSPQLRRCLAERPFCDLGDLDIAPGDVDGALRAIKGQVAELLAEGLRPVMLGGEHLVSLPAVEAAARRYPDLHVLQIDAHADLRDDYLGLPLSHACVMRRIAERVGPARCLQLGIRSGTSEEWAYAQDHTRFAPGAQPLPAEWAAVLRGVPLYLTVDIDAADPAAAPGTGTPEPGGFSARELLEVVWAMDGLNIVAADVVEVAPAYDPGGITAVLAAKVVRELLLM